MNFIECVYVILSECFYIYLRFPRCEIFDFFQVVSYLNTLSLPYFYKITFRNFICFILTHTVSYNDKLCKSFNKIIWNRIKKS